MGFFIISNSGCKSSKAKLEEIAKYEKIGDEKSIRVLLKYLKNKDDRVREEAAYALGARTCCWCPHHSEPTKIGRLNDERVLKGLLKLLKDKSWRVRLAAVYSLTVYRNPIMVEPLIEALKDTSGKKEWTSVQPVGSYAAYTLGELKDKRAIEPLVQALRSEEKDIRLYAKHALIEMGEGKRAEEEIEKLIPFILSELQSKSYDVLEREIGTAGMFKISEAVPQLNKLLKDKDPKIRASAASALIYLEDKTSIPLLLEALKDPEPMVRGNAAKALGRMREKSALLGILKLLEDDVIFVRVWAINTLRFYDESEIFPPLIKAIGDKNSNIARAAVYVLGQKFGRNLGNPESHKDLTPRILQMMSEMTKGDELRYSAIEILIALKDKRAVPLLFDELKSFNVEEEISEFQGEIRIKVAKFIAKMGNEEQKREAINWLKTGSKGFPDLNHQKQATEALKELNVTND